MLFGFDPVGYVLGLIPDWAWWALGALAILFVIGVIWRLRDFMVLVHRIASWPGVAAVIGVIVLIVSIVWPRKKQESTITTKPNVRKKPSRVLPKDPPESLSSGG